jgi:hypothetical protein
VSELEFSAVFDSEQSCVLEAFAEGLKRLSRTVDEAVAGKRTWLERLRTGVVAFLGFLDDERGWGRLLILEAPIADGVLALRCQQRVLGVLTGLLDDGAPQAMGELSPEPMLTSELVAGGVVSVIRARMLRGEGERWVQLAPQLMSFIVGQAAAGAELAGESTSADGLAPVAQLPMRPTRRTLLVLRAIAQVPRSNNREVAQAAGVGDEGQASKLLARLERRGVIENVGVGAARGEPNAWLLTPYGQRVVERISGCHAEDRARC